MEIPRTSPDALIDQLVAHPGTEVVRRASLQEFLGRHPRALLFFTGDLAQNPEGRDVAIVVRELLRQYSGRLALGLVDRRDETVVMAKSGVVVLPAVAFVADGRTVDVVARMRDWGAYAQAAEHLFGAGDGST
jgi:hydrogenase-1 operon protein HyaE